MVCIDLDETGSTRTVVNVVLGTDHDDVALARDYRGQFLVYDEAMPADRDRRANRRPCDQNR